MRTFLSGFRVQRMSQNIHSTMFLSRHSWWSNKYVRGCLYLDVLTRTTFNRDYYGKVSYFSCFLWPNKKLHNHEKITWQPFFWVRDELFLWWGHNSFKCQLEFSLEFGHQLNLNTYIGTSINTKPLNLNDNSIFICG